MSTVQQFANDIRNSMRSGYEEICTLIRCQTQFSLKCKMWTVTGIILVVFFIFFLWASGEATATCDDDCFSSDAPGLDCSQGCYECKGDMSDYCIADCGFWTNTDCNQCECGDISAGGIVAIILMVVTAIGCCICGYILKRRNHSDAGPGITTPIIQKALDDEGRK